MAAVLRSTVGTAFRSSARYLHQTCPRRAITNLEMPAMSPTMTEGGIATWKKKEGENFSAGDVLLEVETDKATIDVEAQDDGVLGKILVPEGSKNIKVGKIIALLAEEGDDISNLEPPKETERPPPSASQSQQAAPESSKIEKKEAPKPPPKSHSSNPPSHSRPLFPSVHRLLAEHGVDAPENIKGTGIRGMLTKGDVLAYLGLASSPLGTFQEIAPSPQAPAAPKKQESRILDGPTLRQLIASSMLKETLKARNPPPNYELSFDSVLADYGVALPSKKPTSSTAPPPPRSSKSHQFLDGLI